MTELPVVEIVEVSPRDGLQNEKRTLSVEQKVELIERAAALGVRRVEITSFVRPDRVPQLADAAEVAAAAGGIDVVSSALALNLRGYERAIDAGVRDVNTVVLATETFSQKNQGMSVAEVIAGVAVMRERALRDGVWFTVTLSAAFGCPFEGEVREDDLRAVLARVVDLGPDEITLADTIGVAVPTEMTGRFGLLRELAPALPMRVHLHDTRNTAIANAVAAVGAGVTVLDASLGGIGGCPFAPGATGNVATEDLIYSLERMGFGTGLDLDDAIGHARWLVDALGVAITGRVAKVGGFPGEQPRSADMTATTGPLNSTVLTATCSSDLDEVTSGRTAECLGGVFISVRDAAALIAARGEGGGVLLVIGTDEQPASHVIASAVRALVRGLAREYATAAVRINAVVGATPARSTLVDFLAGPAATALTGAVFDLRER